MRILIFITLLSLFACKAPEKQITSTSNTDVKKAISFTVLSSGTNSGFTTKINQVIQDQATFQKVWDVAHVNYMEKKPLPAIDFSKQTVVLVAMGEHNSGGYDLSVKSIIERESLTLTTTETRPGMNCMNTSVMTYPYQIIVFNTSNKKLSFAALEKIIDCSKQN